MAHALSLLGSTGSIGVSTLDVVRRFPARYSVKAMAAGDNVELFARQITEFSPELVSVKSEENVFALKQRLPGYKGEILWGEEGNRQVATYQESETVLSAIVGAAGLLPTLAAIKAKKNIALANKETLVIAGRVVMEAAAANGVAVLPVDSEHSAIFQALDGGRRQDVKKILLTASGGPFRGKSRQQLTGITPEQAVAHPNWSMGRKISVDSATLMNKGLEVIEARWLFDMEPGNIDVLVHPQSIIHSAVEYQDGSILAQMGVPDMRIPIAYALSYPERMELGLTPLDLTRCGTLEFYQPDMETFPALKLAFDALQAGGVAPAVLNAANEVAVAAFLQRRIEFLQISETVAQTMDIVEPGADSLEAVLAADKKGRETAETLIRTL